MNLNNTKDLFLKKKKWKKEECIDECKQRKPESKRKKRKGKESKRRRRQRKGETYRYTHAHINNYRPFKGPVYPRRVVLER